MSTLLDQLAEADATSISPLFGAFVAAYEAGWAAEHRVQELAARVDKGRTVVKTQPRWTAHLTALQAEHGAAVSAEDAAVAAYWETRCRLLAAEAMGEETAPAADTAAP